MNRRSLVAVLAVSSTLGGMAFAQSSDIRQQEQDLQKQARERAMQRPEYLPGDRAAVERMERDEAARQRNEAARQREEADRQYRRDQRARGDPRGQYRYDPGPQYRYDPGPQYGYDPRGPSRGYYRPEEWRHSGRGAGPRHDWYRGGYLPREYRGRHYVVDDWRAHRLYAPPSGYHWVQSGGDYVLVAIATGLIAAILLNQ